MNLAEITHRAYFLDCYPLDERHLKISIQTGKDVDEVILWAGDPYSAGIAENEQNWQGERVPMELERELAHRNVTHVRVLPSRNGWMLHKPNKNSVTRVSLCSH